MTSWLSFCLRRSWKWRRLLFMLRWLGACYWERFMRPLLLTSSALVVGFKGCLRVLCDGLGGLMALFGSGKEIWDVRVSLKRANCSFLSLFLICCTYFRSLVWRCCSSEWYTSYATVWGRVWRSLEPPDCSFLFNCEWRVCLLWVSLSYFGGTRAFIKSGHECNVLILGLLEWAAMLLRGLEFKFVHPLMIIKIAYRLSPNNNKEDVISVNVVILVCINDKDSQSNQSRPCNLYWFFCLSTKFLANSSMEILCRMGMSSSFSTEIEKPYNIIWSGSDYSRSLSLDTST